MFTEVAAERPAVTWQPSLLGAADAVGFSPTLEGVRRRFLGQGAWVDVVPAFVTGADLLFQQILDRTTWHAFERPMYDRVVGVPRLESRQWRERPTVVDDISRALGHHYGLPLPSMSANLYRDGNDSVAWHGDQVGRDRVDTVVAILSLGASRQLLLRPDGGGPSTAFPLHSGDLLVKGGTCQRTFEHSVPKRARAGPRISVMFREAGGR